MRGTSVHHIGATHLSEGLFIRVPQEPFFFVDPETCIRANKEGLFPDLLSIKSFSYKLYNLTVF
jgi:hypothetical protein